MRALIWDLGGTLVDTYPDVDRALALYAECKERDEWPGLADSHTIHTLTDTPWTHNYDEQEEVIYG